jgi:hypothetical protein
MDMPTPALLSFRVSNHRSIREPVEISFVATARRDEPTHRFPSAHTEHGVLPMLGLWGANASGKTSVVDALELFQFHVAQSFIGARADAPVRREPWRGRHDEPTEMVLEFIDEHDRRHQLGMVIGPEGFDEEWLAVWEPETRRQQVWYRRSKNGWYFGPRLKGPKQAIADQTRANSLFLAAAAQHNHPELLPVYSFVTQRLVPAVHDMRAGFPIFEADHPMLSEAFRPLLRAFLRAADLGVDDVAVVPMTMSDPAQALHEVFQPAFLERFAKKLLVRLELVRGQGADAWQLPSAAESLGTWALIQRLADLARLPATGGLLIIDEIDSSLHPDLCRAFVELFAQAGGKHQLLFTSHDRGLLQALRTDEVVLIDKRDHATVIASASDFRGLRARDDVERAHRAGRIGAVPVLGDLAGALDPGR